MYETKNTRLMRPPRLLQFIRANEAINGIQPLGNVVPSEYSTNIDVLSTLSGPMALEEGTYNGGGLHSVAPDAITTYTPLRHARIIPRPVTAVDDTSMVLCEREWLLLGQPSRMCR